jgi:predicted acetyltransferase
MNVTLSVRMPVPGGSVAAGALTWVGVHPAHRRRGVLTAMMRRQLDDVRERGEPVSALWAAEPAIYGRFGYGLATRSLSLTLPRGAAMRDVPGCEDLHVTFERLDQDRHTELLAACYEAARQSRPGWVSRPRAAHWRAVLDDQAPLRRGTESLRVLLAREGGPDGDLRGYALFRRAVAWQDSGPDGTVKVQAMVARDAATARAVWGRLADLDLMSRVTTDARPPDDPLVHLLVDVRAAAPRTSDGLWLRVVDVPGALAARRYTCPVDVVLDVRDAFCPWNEGRWRLTGGPDGATCTRSDDDADLALDVRDLGAAYLGGESLSALAAAGLVTERHAGAVDPAARAFAWHVAPYCGWMF